MMSISQLHLDMGRDPDEMVLAGGVPSQSADPMSMRHRQLTSIMLFAVIGIGLVIYTLLDALMPGLGLGAMIPAVMMGLVWSGFRNRRKWAFPFAVALNAVSIFIFLFLGLSMLVSMNGLSMILGLGFILVAINTYSRTGVMVNPLFKAWYMGMEIPMFGPDLAEGEVYAGCPHCSSILAIKPRLLSTDDRCPNCNGLLVLPREEE